MLPALQHHAVDVDRAPCRRNQPPVIGMGHHRCRSVAALVATALCLVAVHEGRCGAAARPLRRPQAVEERTAPAPASEAATLDVAAAEAPEGVRWGVGGDEALNAGKWLPMPMPMSLTFPAASALAGGLRFPPVSLFPGASMPWLPGAPPAFAGPGGGLPGLVPPYIGATRQEQLSLWASLFNPMQVRPRLPASTLGGGGETTGGQVDRGAPAIASGGKAVEGEGETMDVPAAGAVPLGEPKWGVFLGNIDHRH